MLLEVIALNVCRCVLYIPSQYTKIIIYDLLCDGVHFVPTLSILQINYKASTHVLCYRLSQGSQYANPQILNNY